MNETEPTEPDEPEEPDGPVSNRFPRVSAQRS